VEERDKVYIEWVFVIISCKILQVKCFENSRLTTFFSCVYKFMFNHEDLLKLKEIFRSSMKAQVYDVIN
jgi:hypothetical protein